MDLYSSLSTDELWMLKNIIHELYFMMTNSKDFECIECTHSFRCRKIKYHFILNPHQLLTPDQCKYLDQTKDLFLNKLNFRLRDFFGNAKFPIENEEFFPVGRTRMMIVYNLLESIFHKIYQDDQILIRSRKHLHIQNKETLTTAIGGKISYEKFKKQNKFGKYGKHGRIIYFININYKRLISYMDSTNNEQVPQKGTKRSRVIEDETDSESSDEDLELPPPRNIMGLNELKKIQVQDCVKECTTVADKYFAWCDKIIREKEIMKELFENLVNSLNVKEEELSSITKELHKWMNRTDDKDLSECMKRMLYDSGIPVYELQVRNIFQQIDFLQDSLKNIRNVMKTNSNTN
jgi:hypothetical protein